MYWRELVCETIDSYNVPTFYLCANLVEYLSHGIEEFFLAFFHILVKEVPVTLQMATHSSNELIIPATGACGLSRVTTIISAEGGVVFGSPLIIISSVRERLGFTCRSPLFACFESCVSPFRSVFLCHH